MVALFKTIGKKFEALEKPREAESRIQKQLHSLEERSWKSVGYTTLAKLQNGDECKIGGEEGQNFCQSSEGWYAIGELGRECKTPFQVGSG